MTQVVLPQTIDAGTDALASEVQSDLVAIRDVVNGQLEGGSGAAGNIKADGITAREIADAIMQQGLYGAIGDVKQEGVMASGDGRVTPGAGLVLNFAAGTMWVNDDSAVIASGALIPVILGASSVTIAANASGNPRLDQIVLTVSGFGTGTVSIVQGTPNAATTIETRTGAAALPAGAIRLADILMPNGFAGPFVQATHIRDRRQWARGFHKFMVGDGSGDQAIGGTGIWTYFNGSIVHVELATNSRLRMVASGSAYHTSAGNAGFVAAAVTSGASVFAADKAVRISSPGANEIDVFSSIAELVPAANHVLVGIAGFTAVNNLGIANSGTNGSWTLILDEVIVPNVDNTGA